MAATGAIPTDEANAIGGGNSVGNADVKLRYLSTHLYYNEIKEVSFVFIYTYQQNKFIIHFLSTLTMSIFVYEITKKYLRAR